MIKQDLFVASTKTRYRESRCLFSVLLLDSRLEKETYRKKNSSIKYTDWKKNKP